MKKKNRMKLNILKQNMDIKDFIHDYFNIKKAINTFKPKLNSRNHATLMKIL